MQQPDDIIWRHKSAGLPRVSPVGSTPGQGQAISLMRGGVFLALVSTLLLVPAFAQDTTSGSAGQLPEGLSASDWSGIRAAYEVDRHAAHAVAGGYRAANPGQQWSTVFDGLGFITTPNAGGWSWGLELECYGFAGQERAVGQPAQVRAEGPHVAYDWDEALTEWWINDARGLEHGYTIRHRPPHPEEHGPLTLTLALRGDLELELNPGGCSARFTDANGAALLTYSGLAVLDADARPLPARMESTHGGLRITIDDAGARYPLTVDPTAQQAYLKASNTDPGDQFGNSISVSGDTVVVGAPLEASNATGVNGDQTSNGAAGAGAAYVFVRSGTSWSQQAYLKASNAEKGDRFGQAVAVSGDTVIVGAYFEDSATTPLNHGQNDNSAKHSGAAYVFVRNGTSWSQQAYLKALKAGAGDEFGYSISVSGDTVVVGAYLEDSGATGVDGDQTNNGADGAGAAYVFVRSGTSWSQQAYLKASNTDGHDMFGSSVSVSGDTVVVGAPGESSNATGVDGNQAGNGENDSGAAYVFVRSGTSWSQQAYLKASNTEMFDDFGFSVSASGETVVVGALWEDSTSTGVDGDQNADSSGNGFDAGAAYVFVRSGTSWSQQAYLKASNTGAGDEFGYSVSVSGDTVVVGAQGESSNATGVNGNQADNGALASGAAYVFARSGTNWSQQEYLKASNTEAFDAFGWSVSVSADTVVVGAYREDSSATGVDGDQTNNGAPDSSAAYVFGLAAPPPTAWTDQGCALAGVFGDPLLTGTGNLVASSNNSADLSNAAPNATAGLFLALSSTPVPFKGGTLKPFPFFDPTILATSPAGTLPIAFVMPAGVPSGTSLWVQWAIQDAAAIHGVSLSNAIMGITP